MNLKERIQALEQKFIDYSDNAQNLVFFIRNELTGPLQFMHLIEMKQELLMDTNEIMCADQQYMALLGKPESHPNYEKFMTYMKIAKSLLDAELTKKNA